MEPLVLVACECSQVVCSAFRRAGYTAFSCDLVPCYGGHPEWHIIGDAEEVVEGRGSYLCEDGSYVIVEDRWTMIIAHPPCTMLSHVSSVALSQGKHTLEDIKEGRRFFMKMLESPARYVAVENPAPLGIANLPRYNQILQPYNFGHPYSKRVCLWLKGLPHLLPMRGYYLKHIGWHDNCGGGSRKRSETFEGIAEAMAYQWGGLLE